MDKDNLKNSSYTLEDRKLIEKYLKLGISMVAISKLLGKSTSGLQRETLRLGDRKKYNAEEAHKHAIQNPPKIGNPSGEKMGIRVSELEERINKLCYQIEIILDIIKDLQNEKTNN